jgi:alpha-1,2-mannosyltransferase
VLAALWLTPLIARGVAAATVIPLGVPAMAAAFVLTLTRAFRNGAPTTQGCPAAQAADATPRPA